MLTTQCTAVFEKGVLRPTTPLQLEEGAEVQLLITPRTSTPDQRSPAELLAEVAALPTNGGDPGTSRDHDRVLYGEQGAR
jgi:predicted DNA-binding antitoxin AbrB/MazE fold protein